MGVTDERQLLMTLYCNLPTQESGRNSTTPCGELAVAVRLGHPHEVDDGVVRCRAHFDEEREMLQAIAATFGVPAHVALGVQESRWTSVNREQWDVTT